MPQCCVSYFCCGKSINEQIESNSQQRNRVKDSPLAVAKVSMNKLKAIHNTLSGSKRRALAVAKVSMNKLKAIHNIVPSSTH